MDTTCKHKYIDMEDGSGDKFCIMCSKKVKQAVAYMSIPQNIPNTMERPSLNETININISMPNTSDIQRKIIEQIQRNMQGRCR